MTIKEAIEIAFKGLGKQEAHVKELAAYIQGSIAEFKEQDVESVQRSVTSFLAQNVKNKNTQAYKKVVDPKTKRPRKGIYAPYKKKVKPINIKQDAAKKIKQPSLPGLERVTEYNNTSNTEKLYFGKAGEFAVVGELLFRGYNASIMSVDEGVDITASKDNQFFFIQVKSTGFTNDRIALSIRPNNFVNNSNANIFYIIVFRYLSNKIWTNRYIIISERDIDKYTFKGLISNKDGAISIKIRLEEGRLLLYNGSASEDIEYHLDNFDIIR